MKKYKSLLTALLILLFFVSGFQHEAKGQRFGEGYIFGEGGVEGNWSGTISFKEEGKEKGYPVDHGMKR